MTLETTRRRALKALTAAGLVSLSGGVQAQVGEPDTPTVYGMLVDSGTPPDPNGLYLDTWDQYRFVYIDDRPASGAMHTITHNQNSWQQVATKLVDYGATSLPASPPNEGVLLYDRDRGIPTWWDSDNYLWPNFVDDVLLTEQQVANTTTQTEVFSISINGNSLIKGRTYQLELMGRFSTANNTDTFDVIIDIGGKNAATLSSEPENATDAAWSLTTTFTVRDDGTSGTIVPDTRALFDVSPKGESHTALTIDTTVVEMLTADIQWSAADAANSANLEQAHFKQMA